MSSPNTDNGALAVVKSFPQPASVNNNVIRYQSSTTINDNEVPYTMSMPIKSNTISFVEVKFIVTNTDTSKCHVRLERFILKYMNGSLTGGFQWKDIIEYPDRPDVNVRGIAYSTSNGSLIVTIANRENSTGNSIKWVVDALVTQSDLY
jgi:hypothetical protein